MTYKGFEIAKKRTGLYYIIAMGSVIGTAKNERAAMQWIDELCYLEEV